MISRSHFTALLAFAVVFQCVRVGLAQANLQIALDRSVQGVLSVSWRSDSLVPPPGLPLFGKFRIETSSDLRVWTPTEETIAGIDFPNQRIQRQLPDGGAFLFVRVESILHFDGMDLIAQNLANANLSRARFAGCDFFLAELPSANLRGADLSASDFRFADLSTADLREATAMGATFAGANLQDVDARRANLSFCDFTDADVSFANFSGSDLRFTSLLAAASDFLILHNSQIDPHTRFSPRNDLVWRIVNRGAVGETISNRDLGNTSLLQANLENSTFSNCSLRACDLRGANLSGANLLTSLLDFAALHATRISQTTQLTTKARLVWEILNEDATGRDLRNRDLSSTFLVLARLHNVNLSNANLRFIIASEADFSGATLRSAILIGGDLIRANFQNADLTGANLSNADLTGANLFGATLLNTIQTGAIFSNTIMPDGSVRNR